MNYDLYLTKADRKALEGSIKKWEGIVAGTMIDEGVANCPLCQIYCCCEGCPVQEWTGAAECMCTPYADYEIAYRQEDGRKMKVAAKKELAFLKDLLRRGID